MRLTVRRNRKIATDAPSDNKGKGEAFSPTDLVATALGTCMSTIMGMKAAELGVDLRGMTVSVQKEMSKDAPRRIVGLPSEVHIPLSKVHNIAKRSSKPRSIAPCTKVYQRRSIAQRNFSGKVEPAALRRFERSRCRFEEQWKRMFPICCR